MRRIFHNSIAPLLALALIATLLRCAYVIARSPLSSPAASLAIVCWAWPVLIWMDYDAVRRRRRPCFDFGLFLAVAFPFSVLWYCFWSRGWRGMKMLLGLGALLFVPIIAASFVEEFGGKTVPGIAVILGAATGTVAAQNLRTNEFGGEDQRAARV